MLKTLSYLYPQKPSSRDARARCTDVILLLLVSLAFMTSRLEAEEIDLNLGTLNPGQSAAFRFVWLLNRMLF